MFLVLKLTDIIDWSWLWVTSPLWIGAAISVVFFALWLPEYLAANKRTRELDREIRRRRLR